MVRVDTIVIAGSKERRRGLLTYLYARTAEASLCVER